MSGFTNMVGSLYIFVVVKTYPAMAAAMTTAGAYWFYASVRFVTQRRNYSAPNLQKGDAPPIAAASSLSPSASS